MSAVIEIIVIGNEILSGRTKDRNAVHMIDAFESSGYAVRYISVIGDVEEDIARVLRLAAARSDVALVTGGLGPTSDDITIESAARAFDRELNLDGDVLRHIEELFRTRKRFMSESNKKQAYIPDGAEALENPLGTAPGVEMKVDGGVTGDCSTLYFMPGVPKEMQALFDTLILPKIMNSFKPMEIETASVNVSGISESELFDKISHLPGAVEAFAFYPHYSGIEVKIKTDSNSPVNANDLQSRMVDIMGSYVFSTDGLPLENAIARLMTEKGLTLAIAESCTGGLIDDRITNVPGSSAFLMCGVVSYSNESKINVLGVSKETIAANGAVSSDVAAEMAEGVRKISGADIGISTTGIAGPGGGSPEKPVGLMFAGISTAESTRTKKLQFVENRIINKSRMSQAVLNILRRYLVGYEM